MIEILHLETIWQKISNLSNSFELLSPSLQQLFLTYFIHVQKVFQEIVPNVHNFASMVKNGHNEMHLLSKYKQLSSPMH